MAMANSFKGFAVAVLVAALAYFSSFHLSENIPSSGVAEGTKSDPNTRIPFPTDHKFAIDKKTMKLLGVGTRKKAGIVNVYSVGFYSSKAALKTMEGLSGIDGCNSVLRSKSSSSKAVMLTFAMGVGAEKIAEALADVNAPDDVKLNFVKMLVTGIGGKMLKGESMTIEWKAGTSYIVLLTARGKIIGEIKNELLYNGLLETYLGGNSVSPSLRQDIGILK